MATRPGKTDNMVQARARVATYQGISTATALEAMAIAMALSFIAVLSGGKLTDWLGTAAVFITFLHGQLPISMEESQDSMDSPTVPHYHWTSRLFVTKELLWISTFAIAGCWPLCAGSILFATYPKWRLFVRRHIN